jgi:hypothetical protein
LTKISVLTYDQTVELNNRYNDTVFGSCFAENNTIDVEFTSGKIVTLDADTWDEIHEGA